MFSIFAQVEEHYVFPIACVDEMKWLSPRECAEAAMKLGKIPLGGQMHEVKEIAGPRQQGLSQPEGAVIVLAHAPQLRGQSYQTGGEYKPTLNVDPYEQARRGPWPKDIPPSLRQAIANAVGRKPADLEVAQDLPRDIDGDGLQERFLSLSCTIDACHKNPDVDPDDEPWLYEFSLVEVKDGTPNIVLKDHYPIIVFDAFDLDGDGLQELRLVLPQQTWDRSAFVRRDAQGKWHRAMRWTFPEWAPQDEG